MHHQSCHCILVSYRAVWQPRIMWVQSVGSVFWRYFGGKGHPILGGLRVWHYLKYQGLTYSLRGMAALSLADLLPSCRTAELGNTNHKNWPAPQGGRQNCISLTYSPQGGTAALHFADLLSPCRMAEQIAMTDKI